MKFKRLASHALNGLRMGLTAVALFQFSIVAPLSSAQTPDPSKNTTSPIKHVIIIIGENRSFDHVFATYVPKKGETVNNLLSEGIIKLDPNKRAIPGPDFEKAHQLAATDIGGVDSFLLNPPKHEFPNNQLPAPLNGGPTVAYFPNLCDSQTPVPPINDCPASQALAIASESGLEMGSAYYTDLLTGGS